MWKFVVVTAGCLLLVCQCQAQYGRRASPMGGLGSGIFNFGRGFSIDFNKFNSLEAICNSAVMQTGVTDHLSDVMRNAVQYKIRMGANPLTLGGTGANSAKWNCLMGAATSGGTNMGNAANGVGDYFDTAAELRIQPFLPFKYNPCEMVFCGEQGMTPAAMAREVMMRLQSGMPLGRLASAFGQHASRLGGGMGMPGRMPSPMGMGGMMGGGMMGAMNPMQGMSAMRRSPMAGGNMGGMMQQMMKMMNPMAASMKAMGALKSPSSPSSSSASTNAVTTGTGTDPTGTGTSQSTNGTSNTVTASQGGTPAASTKPSASSGTAMSNALPTGGGGPGSAMMSNPFKAMAGLMPSMGGAGGGIVW